MARAAQPARPARPAPLDRATIIEACAQIVGAEGAEALTLRRLGAELGVDPTAVYRHFRDKEDLLRAVGDHAHREVLDDLGRAPGVTGASPWREGVRELCTRLRAAHLARPDLAALVRAAPSLHEHELHVTETLLRELRRGGLDDDEVVWAYHSLIELTVGSAAIDAVMAGMDPRDRAATYRSWRRTYAALDEREFPEATRLAAGLYPGDADARFVAALDRLLDGIAARRSAPGARRAARRTGRS